MSYEAKLKERIQVFESELSNVFLDQTETHARINEAMRYSLNAGGKRLRPILLREVSMLYGCPHSKSKPFALALEMIHTYSLIHDDLPAMDNDDLRRGKPTNHKVFGEDIAILAGDGLLNLAVETMTQAVISDPETIVVMDEIIRASGTNGMILGQVADIKNHDVHVTKETLDFINAHKTGKLLTAAFVGGALLGNAPKKDVDLFRTIGYEAGLLFQMADDVLDIIGDEKKLGKSTQNDLKNNKQTYPVVMGLEETKMAIETCKQRIVNALNDLSVSSTFLKETINFLSSREY